MKEITRTIFTSIIYGSKIIKEANKLVEIELDPISHFGEKVNEDQANRLLRKAYGKTINVIVNRIETCEEIYALSFADFIEHAHVLKKRDLPQTMDESQSDQERK